VPDVAEYHYGFVVTVAPEWEVNRHTFYVLVAFGYVNRFGTKCRREYVQIVTIAAEVILDNFDKVGFIVALLVTSDGSQTMSIGVDNETIDLACPDTI
jgi:hypothetical protein